MSKITMALKNLIELKEKHPDAPILVDFNGDVESPTVCYPEKEVFALENICNVKLCKIMQHPVQGLVIWQDDDDIDEIFDAFFIPEDCGIFSEMTEEESKLYEEKYLNIYHWTTAILVTVETAEDLGLDSQAESEQMIDMTCSYRAARTIREIKSITTTIPEGSLVKITCDDDGRYDVQTANGKFVRNVSLSALDFIAGNAMNDEFEQKWINESLATDDRSDPAESN